MKKIKGELIKYLQKWTNSLCGDTKLNRMEMLKEMLNLMKKLGVKRD